MGGSLAPGYSNIPNFEGKPQRGDAHSDNATTRTVGSRASRGSLSSQSSSYSVEDAVRIVLPLYYTKEQLTTEELTEARRVWRLVVNNQSQYFLDYQKQQNDAGGEKPAERCSEYFVQLYYLRLFDTHPAAKQLFEHSQTTRMKVHFISLLTMLLDTVDQGDGRFTKSLEALVKGHNRIGVRAVEYGIGCEILMYCIKKCVGATVYTPAVHIALTKFFSRMLDVVVPLVIQFEMSGMANTLSRKSSATSVASMESEGAHRVMMAH